MENLVFVIISAACCLVVLGCIWTFVSGNWYILPLVIVGCFVIAAMKDIQFSLNRKYLKSHESAIKSVIEKKRVHKNYAGGWRDVITYEVTFTNTKRITFKIIESGSWEHPTEVEMICRRHLSHKDQQ